MGDRAVPRLRRACIGRTPKTFLIRLDAIAKAKEGTGGHVLWLCLAPRLPGEGEREANQSFTRRVAQLSPFSLPILELWVPRPFDSAQGRLLRSLQGRVRCCRYHGVCYALRIASYLRRSSPALYHLLVLSAIAFSARGAQPRPLPLDPGTDAPALSVRGRGICRHAGAHPSAFDGTRS